MIFIAAYLRGLFEQHQAFFFSMLLSAYTWASGLYAAIPGYAIIDSLLAILTLFHIFVAISFVSVYDAFYKKTLMLSHYKIAKIFIDQPLFLLSFNVLAMVAVVHLSYQAYYHGEDTNAVLRAVIAINTWASSIFLQRVSTILVKLGVDSAIKMEQDMEKHDIKNWTEPPKWTASLCAPINMILRPKIYGAENIPKDKGGLYVMNHALLGLEMAPFVATMYAVGGVFLRGLSDLIHFGQLHGEFIRYFGGVAGTRDNVDVLMEANQNVLVYPGGGHEIMKPSTVPNYTLMWKQRLGFARMAIKHGYPVVPCCSVGTEDMWQRLFDVDVGFIRKDQKIPVCILRPDRLQKVYFWVGEPIPTSQYNGDFSNTEFAQEVRDKAKAAIEAGIREMQEIQANDPDRYVFAHIVNATKRMMGKVFGGSSTKTIEEPIPAPKKID